MRKIPTLSKLFQRLGACHAKIPSLFTTKLTNQDKLLIWKTLSLRRFANAPTRLKMKAKPLNTSSSTTTSMDKALWLRPSSPKPLKSLAAPLRQLSSTKSSRSSLRALTRWTMRSMLLWLRLEDPLLPRIWSHRSQWSASHQTRFSQRSARRSWEKEFSVLPTSSTCSTGTLLRDTLAVLKPSGA